MKRTWSTEKSGAARNWPKYEEKKLKGIGWSIPKGKGRGMGVSNACLEVGQ